MLDPRYLRLALLAAQERAKREPAPKAADEPDTVAPKPAETPAT
jgi:hypothetical protein